MRSTDWDKIAPAYFMNIDSPFHKGVKNPMFAMLKRLGNLENKTVLEVGCGTGTLVPFLSKNFKRVVATDLSPKMVEIARQNNPDLANVEFKVMDMLNISRLKEKFDVVVSVNSIIMPNLVKVNKVFKKIFNRLKRGGRFVAIFPSIDALVYQSLITYDKEFEKRHDRKKAKRATSAIVGNREHDFCYGFFNIGGKQKHYYGFELDYRLKLAGFKKFTVKRVDYPWDMMVCDPNPKRFEGGIYEKLWDWVVNAEK